MPRLLRVQLPPPLTLVAGASFPPANASKARADKAVSCPPCLSPLARPCGERIVAKTIICGKRTLSVRWNIDVETRSTVDLRKTSAKVYARHPDTDIIVVRYCCEAFPHAVYEWRCQEGDMGPLLKQILVDPSLTLVAHNAGFEHAILTAPHLVKKYRIPSITLDRWDDTAARAARMALPRSLEQSAKALDLPVQKDVEGARIMMQLCKPRSYDDNGKPIWWDDPAKLQRLSEYCAVDVRVGTKLSEFTRPLPDSERQIWLMTEEINETGLFVDWKFAEIAKSVANEYLALLDDEMREVTGDAVDGARKVTQLKTWLANQGFYVLDDLDDEKIILDKSAVATLLARDDLPPTVRRALEIRRSAAKSSVAKYEAILNRVDKSTGRVRDTLVYHGASTGRWAGAGIQPQNFPRKTVSDWEAIRKDIVLLSEGEISFADIERNYKTDVMDLLSRMLRGTITAPQGKGLIFPDFSAIEARGVAWVAGAKTLTDLFANGGKVYEEFASDIYRKPISEIGKDSTERFLAKTAILGAGYGMGWKKFILTCAAQGKEVSDEEAKTVIDAYRSTYPEIPALWRGLENAALDAVRHPGQAFVFRGIGFCVKDNFLLTKLPNGRLLFYRKPRIVSVASLFGERDALEYSAVNAVTKQWGRETTWGGKITENVVQGICRDLMAEAMLRLRAGGYKIVGTVHDEVILEVNEGTEISSIIATMCQVPDWARGFPVAAEACYGKRYGK